MTVLGLRQDLIYGLYTTYYLISIIDNGTVECKCIYICSRGY